MPVAASGSYKMFKSSGTLFWKDSPSILNNPRMEFGSAGDEDNALIYGGLGGEAYSTQFTLSCTEEWNGSSWSTVDPLSSNVAGNAGFGTANAALSTGGAGAAYNFSYAISLLNGVITSEGYNGSSWSTAASTNNTARWFRRGTGTQNAGTIVGGQDGGNSCGEVEWYDGISWSSRPDLNYGISLNVLVGNQGEEFSFGGACIARYGSESYFGFINQTNQKSIGGISWSATNPLNTNRVGLSGVGTQNAAIAIGGGEASISLKCTEEWNGSTWSNVGIDQILPVYRNGAKIIGTLESVPINASSSLTVVGGSTKQEFPDLPFSNGTQPNYFNTTSSEATSSIAHGLEEGGSLGDPTQFNTQITDSTSSKYDTFFSGDIRTQSDVSESLQWRNYPGEEQCIASASFEEIFYPGNNTSSLEVTLQVDKVHNSASGSVESGSLESVGFLILTGSENSSITASANAGPNSTFVGWSNTPVFNVPRIFKLFKPIYNLIETSTTLKIDLEEEDQTYYAIFDFDVIEKKYCYTTSNNRNDICLECQEEKTIYFNKTNYENTGSEGITWYENNDLTVTASDGYYYLSGSDNPIVYDLITGSAEFELICEGDIIYCS